jgi:hypothetical protein
MSAGPVRASVDFAVDILPVGGDGQTSQGGGIFNAGELQVLRSLIANNLARRGGGISNTNQGFAIIENTTTKPATLAPVEPKTTRRADPEERPCLR